MTDRNPSVEDELREVASAIDWPEGDVVASALRRVEDREEPSSNGGRLWKVGIAAVLALVIVLAVPTGRQAIARLLGVAGIEVTFGFDGNGEWSDLGLGEVRTAEAAAELAERELSLPKVLAAPDEIRVSTDEVIVVHALWNPGPGLPAVPGTDIGILLTQFESRENTTVFHKALSESTAISLISVGREQGLWIEGAPHEVRYATPTGEVTDVVSRLAGNVLMWEDEGTTFRLETSLGLDEALRLAESVAPVESEPGG